MWLRLRLWWVTQTHAHELSSTILRHPVNQSDGAFLSCSAPEIIVGVKSYNRSVAAFDQCDRLAPGWWLCVCVGGRVVRKLGPCGWTIAPATQCLLYLWIEMEAPWCTLSLGLHRRCWVAQSRGHVGCWLHRGGAGHGQAIVHGQDQHRPAVHHLHRTGTTHSDFMGRCGAGVCGVRWDWRVSAVFVGGESPIALRTLASHTPWMRCVQCPAW